MVSSTETTANTSAAGVTHPSYLPPGMPPLEAMDTLPAPTTENLLPTAGVGRGSRTQPQPQIPTTPGLHQMRPRMPQQQAPTPEGRKRPQLLLIGSRCTHLDTLPPGRVPPPVPVRVVRSQPEKMKAPEVGPHPEGLRTGNEGTDPPPEDPGNAGRASRVAVSWTRCPAMWPQGGSKTSPTSSAAVGWPRWVPWTEMSGMWPSTNFWE